MRRVAVKIAYLGENYAGSQIQPDLRTVEGDVLRDLKKICTLDESAIDLKCASRTDRGVNALDNAIVFYTTFRDNDALLNALNAVSDGVYYRSVANVSEKFNPRHADQRVYRYVFPKYGMDHESVKKCASLFSGKHDFARFCRNDGRPTVMHMHSITVIGYEDTYAIEFRAEHFLWNQIRRISAAIMSVGLGTATVEEVKRALDGEDITFGIAPPEALTLTDVFYEALIFREATSLGQRFEEECFSVSLKKMFYDTLEEFYHSDNITDYE